MLRSRYTGRTNSGTEMRLGKSSTDSGRCIPRCTEANASSYPNNIHRGQDHPTQSSVQHATVAPKQNHGIDGPTEIHFIANITSVKNSTSRVRTDLLNLWQDGTRSQTLISRGRTRSEEKTRISRPH